MTLSKPAVQRLKELEDEARDSRDFRYEVRGALKLVMAVLGLNTGGVVFLIISGIANRGAP